MSFLDPCTPAGNPDAVPKGFLLLRAAFGPPTTFFQEVTLKRQFKFTKKSVEALPPCPTDHTGKEMEYSDSDVAGLRLQVTRLGRKSFLFRYSFNGRKRAMKVGNYPEIGIEEARQQVIEWRTTLHKGFDPQEKREEEAKAGLTFQQFFANYLWPHVLATKRSAKADESRFRNHILPKFGHREMAKITPLEIQQFHNENRVRLAPATANRIFEVIRRSYNLASGLWGLIPPTANSAAGIRLHKENNRRERYLSQGDELKRFMLALDRLQNQDMADIFRLLLATGCRKNEILYLRYDQLRLDRREIYIPRPKSGKGRHVVLNDVASSILERRRPIPGNPYVFPGKIEGRPVTSPERAWRAVLKDAGIDPKTTTLHTLRHTHASYLVGICSLHEIAGILGHASTATTQRYAHLNSSRLQIASNHVAELMASAQQLPAMPPAI